MRGSTASCLKASLPHVPKIGRLPAAALVCHAVPCRRPTFLPAMKLQPLRPEGVLADPRKQVLAGYLAALADLAHPKQALRILEDAPRLQVGGQAVARVDGCAAATACRPQGRAS